MNSSASDFKVNLQGDCFSTVIKEIKKNTTNKSALIVYNTAKDIITQCVKSYSEGFGKSDVGMDGTGKVDSKYTGTQPPIGTNGLMYGRVQSGKTNSTIASIALAHANQFKCFVVLTSDNTWLGKQTADRFSDALGLGDGPIVRNWENWRKDPRGFADEIRDYLEDTGVVLISTKNGKNLENLVTVLKVLKAHTVPGIIFDDEADNASLNTNQAKMARGRASEPSKIFTQIGLIRSQMPNHIFVQVTATPQSLLLQGIDHDLRPGWCHMVEPGDNYVGGDVFFKSNNKYLIPVDSSELDILRGTGKVNPGNKWEIPSGLRDAACCFIVGAAARRMMTSNVEVLSMLIHIDHKKISHESVQTALKQFLLNLDKSLKGSKGVTRKINAESFINDAWKELFKTCSDIPSFEDVLDKIKRTLRNANPEIINADNPNKKPDYRRGMNFLIGGNRLGRGVTIEGLTVSYYGRDAKTKMMDTVHQHARMFGYRKKLLSITRLYSASHILETLKDIFESDEGTRKLIEKEGQLHIKPVWLGPKIKATRANVLNPADISVVTSGQWFYPSFIKTKLSEFKESYIRIEELLGRISENDEADTISFELLRKIIMLVPDDNSLKLGWHQNIILQLINQYEGMSELSPSVKLLVKRGNRGSQDGFDIDKNAKYGKRVSFEPGRVGSGSTKKYSNSMLLSLRKQKGEKGKGWAGQQFYAPTLIMPKTKFAFLYIAE